MLIRLSTLGAQAFASQPPMNGSLRVAAGNRRCLDGEITLPAIATHWISVPSGQSQPRARKAERKDSPAIGICTKSQTVSASLSHRIPISSNSSLKSAPPEVGTGDVPLCAGYGFFVGWLTLATCVPRKNTPVNMTRPNPSLRATPSDGESLSCGKYWLDQGSLQFLTTRQLAAAHFKPLNLLRAEDHGLSNTVGWRFISVLAFRHE